MGDRYRDKGFSGIIYYPSIYVCYSPIWSSNTIIGLEPYARYGYYTLVFDRSRMWDVSTPHFSRLQQQGIILNNPCSRQFHISKVTGHSSSLQIDYRYPNGYVYRVDVAVGPLSNWFFALNGGNLYDSFNTNFPDYSDLVHKTRFDCLAKLDEGKNDFTEDMLELRKTLDYIKKPFGALQALSEAFFNRRKKLQRKRRFSRTKALAQTWLEYRFAIMPLVMSISNALEIAQEGLLKRPPRRSVHAKQVLEINKEFTDRELATEGAVFQRICKMLITVRSHIMYEYTINSASDSFEYTTGLKFSNLPKTVWAVQPYAFMIDRLINISGMIAGIAALLNPNIKILAASTSVEKEISSTIKMIEYRANPDFRVSFNVNDTFIDIQRTYERSPWTISFTDCIPPLDLGGLVNSWKRVLDLTTMLLPRFL